MKRRSEEDSTHNTVKAGTNTQLLFGVANENPHISPVGADLLCRDTATLDDLDKFLRREWFSDPGHASLFCPYTLWENEYQQLENPIWPLTTTLATASAGGEKIGYVFDFGSETNLIFTLKKTISSETPLTTPVVAVNVGPQLLDSKSSGLQNMGGALDDAFPNLSSSVNTQATVEIGKPLKGNNPYITRDTPFISTIFDDGGEYGSGPVHSGIYRGMNEELKDLDDVTRNHVSGNYGSDEDESDENDEKEPTFDFEKNFPKVHKWMLAPGKNWLQFGRCRPGIFFQAFKGRKIVFSADQFEYLHPCFQAFELFLTK